MSQYSANTWSYADGEPITNIYVMPSISQLKDLALSFINTFAEPCGIVITVANTNGTNCLDPDNSRKYQIIGISKQRIIDFFNENLDLLLYHQDISISIFGKSKNHLAENGFYGEALEIKEIKNVSITTRSGPEVCKVLDELGIVYKERTSDIDWKDWRQSIKAPDNSQGSIMDVKSIAEKFKLLGFTYVEWDRD